MKKKKPAGLTVEQCKTLHQTPVGPPPSMGGISISGLSPSKYARLHGLPVNPDVEYFEQRLRDFAEGKTGPPRK